MSLHPVRELRQAADAARVKQAEAGRVAAEITIHPAKVERTRSGDEERALLVVERFEGREIERRRIDLHLSEVRIEGGVEREIRREQILHVAARANARVVASVKRIVRIGVLQLLAREHVRKNLELPPSISDLNSLHTAEIRGPARVAPPPERPHVALVQSVLVAPHLHPPQLHRIAREPQLRIRDAHLRGPAERIDFRRRGPDRIPPLIAVELIAAHAGGIHLEQRLVAVIVIRIEHDDELVRRQRIERPVVAVRIEQLIAARERRVHAARALRLGHARADVDRLIIVEQPNLRGHRRRRALLRLVLPQPRDRRRGAPRRVVEASIDVDGANSARRTSHRGNGRGDAHAVGVLRARSKAEAGAREERGRNRESHVGHLREKARCCFDIGGIFRIARRFDDESLSRLDARARRIV